MINVNQYPDGTLVEASKTEDFKEFVTGAIETQWTSHISYERAKQRTGKEYPEMSEWPMENGFLIRHDEDENGVPSYFLAEYARLPEEETKPPVKPGGVTRAEMFGLLTRLENILLDDEVASVSRSIASMLTDREQMIERVKALRTHL